MPKKQKPTPDTMHSRLQLPLAWAANRSQARGEHCPWRQAARAGIIPPSTSALMWRIKAHLLGAVARGGNRFFVGRGQSVKWPLPRWRVAGPDSNSNQQEMGKLRGEGTTRPPPPVPVTSPRGTNGPERDRINQKGRESTFLQLVIRF